MRGNQPPVGVRTEALVAFECRKPIDQILRLRREGFDHLAEKHLDIDIDALLLVEYEPDGRAYWAFRDIA